MSHLWRKHFSLKARSKYYICWEQSHTTTSKSDTSDLCQLFQIYNRTKQIRTQEYRIQQNLLTFHKLHMVRPPRRGTSHISNTVPTDCTHSTTTHSLAYYITIIKCVITKKKKKLQLKKYVHSLWTSNHSKFLHRIAVCLEILLVLA